MSHRAALPSLAILLGIMLLWSRAATAAPPATPENSDRLGSFFALNGSKIFHIPNDLETTVSARLEIMRELGVSMDRIDFWWGSIEPERGRWDWTIPDKCIAFLESRGVQVYPILAYGAKWWTERTAPLNDEEIAQYAEYVYQMVNRYKGRVTHWAVWNEPNIAPFWTPQPDPDMYAKLLKAASAAARRADPECKLAAPVVAPLGRWDEKFITRLYQLGCKDSFDIFDYHYYRDSAPEKSVPRELAEIRALMAQYGDEDKPIWISEFGVGAPMGGNEKQSYDKQASLVVRNHLVCLAEGVQKLFYFDLQNWHDRPGENWDGKLGLVEADWERKPSFTAYQTMVRAVDHTEAIGRVTGLQHGAEGALFRDTARGEYILAVWMTERGRGARLEVTCEARDIMAVKGDGETIVFAMKPPRAPGQRTRTVAVGVDWHPQYVRGVDEMTYLPMAGVALHPAMPRISPGEARLLRLRLHPALESAVRVINVKAPKGLTWSREEQMLRAGNDAAAGVRDITVELEIDRGAGHKPARRIVSATVEIVPPVRVMLRPLLESGALRAGVSIENVTKTALTNDVRLLMGGKSIATKEGVTIGAMETRSEQMPLDGVALTSRERGVVALAARFGGAASRPVHVYQVVMRDTMPAIDGDLTEWDGLPVAELNAPAQILRGAEGWSAKDASGTIRVWATQHILYVAADVTDDGPMHNPHKANELWRGDAIELYLGFKGPTDRTVLDKTIEFQVGLAPTFEGGKPVAFLFHVDKILETARVAAKPKAGGWTLEAALPLKALGDFTLKPGDLLGFDVALDDLDAGDWAPEANAPGCALMWNGTGTNWIDPSGWGMAVVKE